MPFGFRRFSPRRLRWTLPSFAKKVTNAFRLPPLFSQQAKLNESVKSICHQCLSASAAFLPGEQQPVPIKFYLLSPMPFGFRRFSPQARN